MDPEMEIGTDKKALRINLEANKYGTFAEIGAGQEALGVIGVPDSHLAPTNVSDVVAGPNYRSNRRRADLVITSEKV